jgi:cytoskeletal protein RodZ
MAGKALRILLLVAPLLTGCALWEKKAPAASPEAKQIVAQAEHTKPPTTSVRRPRTTSSPTTATSAPTSQSSAQTAPADGGNAVIVTKPGASTAKPVPLFRQAIVLANVRASVADLPNPPQAEFRQGLLTLTFPRGTSTEVNKAVNRAMGIPEVTRVQVIPAP